MKKHLCRIGTIACLLLFLCSCKAGQPRAVSSEAPAGLSETDRNALVKEFMPPLDRWQESYAALPEEQALASSLPVAPPEVYDEKELPEKLKNIDPGVVKAVEEHVFSPAAWWQHYFDQPDTSDSGLESREQIMSWLLWYKGLSPEDQSRTDQRTHLFFADWEF